MDIVRNVKKKINESLKVKIFCILHNIKIQGIPHSVKNNILEELICSLFKIIGVLVQERDKQNSYHLRKKERTIVNFFNRNNAFHIPRDKKKIKSLDPTVSDFLEGVKIFISNSYCRYCRSIWNKCKMLRTKQKFQKFFLEQVV